MSDLQQARDAKARLRADLVGHDGIEGLGLARSDEGYCLQVNVRRDTDGDGLPDTVDGVDVRVRVVGAVRPQ